MNVEQSFKEEKTLQTKKIPRIREEISILLLVGLGITAFVLSMFHYLIPIYMFLILGAHTLIIKVTDFNEKNPHPFLHFNRNFEGTIILSLFLAAFSYFFSYIIYGFNSYAVFIAELCVFYFYLMLLYVILAGITILGIYFAVQSIVLWFPYFIRIDGTTIKNGAQSIQINLPIILYIDVVLISLMCLGTWFTFTKFIHNSISGKESYGRQTQTYMKTAKLFVIITTILGGFIVYLDLRLSNQALTFFL